MDNITVKDIVFDKKTEGYGFEKKDFVAQQELTVTITLNEYRALVGNNATAQSRIDKAESDRYDRNQEIEKLKKENAELKTELYELQKKLNIEESEDE